MSNKVSLPQVTLDDLAVMISNGFKNSEKMFDAKLSSLEERLIERMDAGFNLLSKRIDSVEKRVGSVENRMDSLENHMGSVEKRLDSVETQIDKMTGNHERRIIRVERKLQVA